MNEQQRHDLAVQVYEYVLKSQVYEYFAKNTESIDEVGADLAHLMAAILKETSVEFGITRPIIVVLDQGFPREHTLWTYIELVGLHTDGRIPTTEEMSNASGVAAKPDAVTRLLDARHHRRILCNDEIPATERNT